MYNSELFLWILNFLFIFFSVSYEDIKRERQIYFSQNLPKNIFNHTIIQSIVRTSRTVDLGKYFWKKMKTKTIKNV